MTGLTSVDLAGNNLSDVSFLKELTGLTYLNLSGNRLREVSFLKELTGLTSLSLGGNNLSDVSFLKELTGLTSLNLRNNKLSYVSFLKELTNLSEVNLDKNPIKEPPPEIVKGGINAIRNYYQSIAEKETTKLFEAKLLIVGQGGAGKTFLMNRLIYNKTPQTKTTEGIEINRWEIETDFIKDFRINFWDFGGQEIYHATHQFFLTKRSLYLFVWEARKDDDVTVFDYWLNVVSLLSDFAPIIMVLNKIDERIKHIDEASFHKKFKNIVSFHKVSAIEKTGIGDLKTDIFKNITALEHVGDTLPKVWLEIRAHLEGLKKNYISYAEYKSICEQYDLNAEKADFLSQYYHDLGVFLHFQDNNILRELVFLKPTWATNAVYKVIDTKHVQKNYGRFNYHELLRIWDDYPEDKYVHLLELMKKFELCFQLPGSNDYIIPELLRPQQPELQWTNTENLRFEYRYDFMPAGIITRFIVRTHDLNKNQIYWKYGTVISRDNTDALVISEPFNRKISIRVLGENRKELLAIIRREIDYIHKTLNEPEVNEMIPCNCSECSKEVEPHFYEFAVLKKYRAKGENKIKCEKSIEDVSIDELLGDYELKEREEVDFRHRGENVYHIDRVEKLVGGDFYEKEKPVEKMIEPPKRKKKWYKTIWGIIVGIGVLIAITTGIFTIYDRLHKDEKTVPKNNVTQDSSKTAIKTDSIVVKK